ncbi:MAG: hypothetical protein ACRD2U_07595 [Terriglobales bacterium]
MNPRLAHLLVRLYPHPWRERYGAEFEALLQAGHGHIGAVRNVIWSALRERIFPTQKDTMNRHSGLSQFQSLCARAPWAIFGVGPLVLLAGAYCAACFILWSGWRIFLPGADTPFGGGPLPLYSFENLYFQAGRLLYFSAPVLVGWGFAFIAARQRIKLVWPAIGLTLIALIGGTAQVHASRTAVTGGFGHIRLDFAIPHSVQEISSSMFHPLIILSLTLLPYLISQLAKTHRENQGV